MPSVSFSIPKYRRHKGTGQSFVQVNGKRHYLGKFGTPESKQRYSRFIAELAVSQSPCRRRRTTAMSAYRR